MPEPKRQRSRASIWWRTTKVAMRFPSFAWKFLWSAKGAALIAWVSLFVAGLTYLHETGHIRSAEDHDVVARVIQVVPILEGYTDEAPHLRVDVAFINRGNQTEIIRDVFLCYSPTNDFWTSGASSSVVVDGPDSNFMLASGEKRVVRLKDKFNPMNTGEQMWLGVGVRAIAPNAEDIVSRWEVCQINLSSDGKGAWGSRNPEFAPVVKIISNTRLPHQQSAFDGL